MFLFVAWHDIHPYRGINPMFLGPKEKLPGSLEELWASRNHFDAKAMQLGRATKDENPYQTPDSLSWGHENCLFLINSLDFLCYFCFELIKTNIELAKASAFFWPTLHRQPYSVAFLHLSNWIFPAWSDSKNRQFGVIGVPFGIFGGFQSKSMNPSLNGRAVYSGSRYGICHYGWWMWGTVNARILALCRSLSLPWLLTGCSWIGEEWTYCWWFRNAKQSPEMYKTHKTM